MSTDEKIKSVEDQLELVLRKQLGKFLCPYCGTSAPVDSLCCEKLATLINELLSKRQAVQIGEAKLQIVEERIREAEAHEGKSSEFLCPYCDRQTKIANGEKYCCKMFYLAWQAVAERLKLERDTRAFEEIAERVYKGITKAQSRPLVTLD